jgi:hypothetical protein
MSTLLTTIQTTINATAKAKYAGLPKKALTRSMTTCTPESSASSRS